MRNKSTPTSITTHSLRTLPLTTHHGYTARLHIRTPPLIHYSLLSLVLHSPFIFLFYFSHSSSFCTASFCVKFVSFSFPYLVSLIVSLIISHRCLLSSQRIILFSFVCVCFYSSLHLFYYSFVCLSPTAVTLLLSFLHSFIHLPLMHTIDGT